MARLRTRKSRNRHIGGTSKRKIKKQGKYRQSRKKLYGGTGNIGDKVSTQELEASKPLDNETAVSDEWKSKMILIKRSDKIWMWAQITSLSRVIPPQSQPEVVGIVCQVNQEGNTKSIVRREWSNLVRIPE